MYIYYGTQKIGVIKIENILQGVTIVNNCITNVSGYVCLPAEVPLSNVLKGFELPITKIK